MRTLYLLCVLSLCAAYPAEAGVHGRCYELTFDDGPDPHTTPKLLDELKAAHVCATFFLIGENAQRHPEIVRREASECHEVGNHSMTHPEHFGRMGASAVRAQFSRAETVLAGILGESPRIARVPGCAHSRAISAAVAGYRVYGCDIDPQDWARRHRDSAYVARYVIAHAVPGTPILLHDIRPTTVAAVPRIIAALKAKGGCFEPVPEPHVAVSAAP